VTRASAFTRWPPWLTTDSKTYPVVIDGRIKWIVDGYTTLENLPYAERTQLDDATTDATHGRPGLTAADREQ
jgi:uncharacterized membrane protein (UPF0182 family)